MCTPEIQARICERLEAGSTQRDACALAGLGYDTFKLWMRKGRKGHEAYVTFHDHIRKAEAKCADRMLAGVFGEGRSEFDEITGQPTPKVESKTFQWWLERRRWKEYSPAAMMAHEANKAARAANLAGLTDEALQDKMLEALKQAAKSNETLRAKLASLGTEEPDGGVEEGDEPG